MAFSAAQVLNAFHTDGIFWLVGSAVAIPAMVVFGVLVFRHQQEGMLGTKIGLFLSLIISGAATLNVLFGLSDIVIDDTRIRRELFGRVWKTVRWQDVKQIRIYSVPRMRLGKTTWVPVYCIDVAGSTFRSITFGPERFLD